VRLLLKDDEEARIFMGANGFVEALLQFLESAVRAGSPMAEEAGAMALFNLTVNNNRCVDSLNIKLTCSSSGSIMKYSIHLGVRIIIRNKRC
jgi:hypothetical protein